LEALPNSGKPRTASWMKATGNRTSLFQNSEEDRGVKRRKDREREKQRRIAIGISADLGGKAEIPIWNTWKGKKSGVSRTIEGGRVLTR